ncbi:MAG: reverse transcriptase/maturase family protein [Pirellulales bacterium]|nr:reverse transcriptase/maturase family protein [Pirellulales bacterium]
MLKALVNAANMRFGGILKLKIMQLDLFTDYRNEKLLIDLFQAYYDARSNKRNTLNALIFEMDFEHKLFQLYKEIITGNYKIKPSICFINFSPVQREIFAADFRDRVVHHLVYNYIAPIFEKTFINDSYSCRVGKGTHYGIKRIDYFIRSCSENYHKDCYILKMDIKGYFMNIERTLLFQKVKNTLLKYSKKVEFDLPLIMGLIKQIIFNDPTKNYILKGNKKDWNGLPPSKSLFHSGENTGLPIGNLTSQLFSNVYLNQFDHYVKKELSIRYYGRYVDDFVIVHPNQNYLKQIIPVIRNYLQSELKLTLHPKKIYLQHFSKGVQFLGAIIKPYRIYISSRTKGNFNDLIHKWNNIINSKNNLSKEEKQMFLSSVNSYLGIMKHYKTGNLRSKIIFKKTDKKFWEYFEVCE